MANENVNMDISLTVKYSSSNIDDMDEKSSNVVQKIKIKEYKVRWVMLSLFSFYWGLSTFQWIEYSIISNIVSKYYGVSSMAVDWTSMSYMLFFVIFVIPGSYIADKINLRRTAILGSFLICLGSWIKIFSVNPNGFVVTFIGQSLLASSQAIILTVPGRLAAQWFPARQVSLATSFAVFGNLLGCSLGFCIPPMIDEPKLPPSETRALQKVNLVNNRRSFTQPMKRLFTNKSYLILCNSYGLNVGVLNAVSTLLNQIYLSHYQNGEEDAGRLGLLLLIMGMFGSITFGAILDKYHKFK
ncbi:hypothetical protein PV326_007008 [Microctonus aethiopoides]|nr:hypothetical protein PV326_007008 [Microctonus aethiopoides]